MNRFTSLFCAFGIALTATVPSVAQQASPGGQIDPFQLASYLIVSGEADQACMLLDVLFGDETTNLKALEFYGDCNLAQGKQAAASRYYQRVLQRAPDSKQVKDKLNSAGAMAAVFRQPEIQAAMAQTASAAAPASELSGSVYLGRVYDSNANGGTTANSFVATIGGAPLTLTVNNASKAAPSWGTQFAGELSYVHPLDAHYASVFGANLSGTFYDSQPDASRINLGINAGLLYRDGPVSLALVPTLRAIWVGNGLDQVIVGADGRGAYQLGGGLALTGNLSAGYSWSAPDANQSGLNVAAATGIQYRFNESVTGGVQVVVRRTSASSAIFSHTDIGPELYLQAALTEGIAVSASYGLAYVGYDAAAAAFPTGRQDWRQNLGLAVDFDLGQVVPKASLNVRYDYSTVDSTVGIYDTERHAVSAGLRYQF